MTKGIFITGTGTDVGKTYISKLLVERLNAAYYKPVASGGSEDCDYVGGYNTYTFKTPSSPHLASQIENKVIQKDLILNNFVKITNNHQFVIVEGAGGIFTPLGEDFFQPELIKELGLDIIIIADSGLGAINSTKLTVEYAKSQGIKIKGIILNNYEDNLIKSDNKKQIEKLTGIPIIATVKKNGDLENFKWIM